MPRQIDLFKQNLQVQSPNNKLPTSAAQVSTFVADMPAQVQAAQERAIEDFLLLLDQETGLDLLGFWNEIKTLTAQANANAAQALQQLSALINSVLGAPGTGFDLATWINSLESFANEVSAWVTRAVNDVLILLDVFHVIYQAGSVGDPPGTLGTNGKPTWYSAWNDFLALFGIVNSTTTPTNPAPTIGAAITTAQTTATSAQSGASTANSNANSALSQLTAVPAQVVVPNLSSGATSVTFDNAGSGGSATNPSGSVSTPLSCTGTQTIGSTANIMVAAVTFSLVGTGSVGNAQVTFAGQSMQSLGIVQFPSITEFVEFFILWNPPAGASQTVSVVGQSFTGGVGSVSFESASYIGATNVSTLITNSGSGTSLSLSAPAAVANTMAVVAFSAGDVITKANTALSSFTKTQRGNTTVQVNSTQYGYQSLAFGDSVGGSGGVTFGAAGADSSAGWIGVGVVLSATSVIGSGFRVANTSTAIVPVSSGYNILNGGMFNGTPTITSDYSYNSATTNTLTVKNAGWYAVTISLLTTTSYTSFMLGPVLYQNGALAQSGMRQYMSSGQSWILQSTFSIYCNAGDTLQPGYYSGVAFSSTFTGESTGTNCYWEVALLNRSLL